MHKKPSDKKPWAGILHVLGNSMDELPGLRGWKTSLGVEPLWGSLEGCRRRTSADTRVLVTLSCPIPSLLLFVFVKLLEFLTKAGVTELCELLCSLSLNFFDNLLNATKRRFLAFAGEHHQVFNYQVWGRDYLHRVTEMLPPIYFAQMVLLIKWNLKVLERIAGKSEVAFHILLINGGGMRHTMLMGKDKKITLWKENYEGTS